MVMDSPFEFAANSWQCDDRSNLTCVLRCLDIHECDSLTPMRTNADSNVGRSERFRCGQLAYNMEIRSKILLLIERNSFRFQKIALMCISVRDSFNHC